MRKNFLFTRLAVIAAMFTLTVVGFANVAFAQTSQRGVTPDTYPGNFVASDDDQVCYELVNQGLIDEFDGEMVGFKVDPPQSGTTGLVSYTLHQPYLDWIIEDGSTMLAVLVKGGPNYNVYDYVGTGFDWDNNLASPIGKNGRYPAISHFNICYNPPADDEGDQGCTPGYWRNHLDRWRGAATTDDFDTTFDVDMFDPNITLGQAISSPQTHGTNAFHAVAALLNAYSDQLGPDGQGQFVAYPYDVATVIAKVQAGEFADLKTANELGCPLSGTPATK